MIQRCKQTIIFTILILAQCIFAADTEKIQTITA